jgi:polyisoprenoid-binding protein YceI
MPMSIPRRSILVVLALLSVPAAAARAEQRVLVLDPAASKVSFTLDATGHDVEGALAVKSGRVAFDPATGAASGEIAVDLKSAKTGNNSRDKTMHDEVLEDGKYPLAVFRAERVRGQVAPEGTSQITLDGTLAFHGADHKVSLPAKVEVHGGRLTAETSFPVPFVEWGLHDPSVMILKVAKVVAVKVKAQGSLEGGTAATGGGRP